MTVNRGAVRRKIRIYIRIIFFDFIFACHVSGHTIIISIKQYSDIDISSSNHYFYVRIYEGLGVSMLIMKSFLLICKGLTNDEMQCVIAGENLGNVFSWTFAWCYKNRTLYENSHSYFFGKRYHGEPREL